MNEIKLSTNLVNAILQYLGTRPYTEVFQVIEAIQKEAKKQNEHPRTTSPHHSPNSTNHSTGNTSANNWNTSMNEIKLSTNLVNAILQPEE